MKPRDTLMGSSHVFPIAVVTMKADAVRSGCIPDCNGNFNGDVDVDGSDAALFKADFGRNGLNDPCETANPCNGDFDCDGDVDGSDSALFKTDFGRGPRKNPCHRVLQNVVTSSMKL